MATEQTANGAVGPEAAGPETISSVVQDPTLQGAAPLTTPDTSVEAPAAVQGAAGKGLVTTRHCLWCGKLEGRIWLCESFIDYLGQRTRIDSLEEVLTVLNVCRLLAIL